MVEPASGDAGSPPIGRGEGPIFPWPTTSGWGVLLPLIAFVVFGEDQVIAMGAFIALAILMVLDFALSAWALADRPVTVLPISRFISMPTDAMRFVASAPAGTQPIRVVLRRWTPLHEDTDFAPIGAEEQTTTLVSHPTMHPRSTKHLRHRSECSIIGLVWARRHTAEAVPFLHLAPGPNAEVDDIPLLSTDVAHLREYVPGDRMSRVSWPTTARTGQLHVRAESLGHDEITVVVDLGANMRAIEMDGRYQAETTLEVAASVVENLLVQGRQVRLVTTELTEAYYDQERDLALQRPELRPITELIVSADATATLFGHEAVRIASALVTDETELIRRLALADHHPGMVYPPAPYVLVQGRGVSVVG